jgi:uncharacterized protein DUF6898
MLRRQMEAGMPGEREVIFEFLRIGGAVKVTAVDAATGTEATIVGDPAAGETALKRIAKRKLDYVMARKGEKP